MKNNAFLLFSLILIAYSNYTYSQTQSFYKISDLSGNFSGILQNNDGFGSSISSIGDFNGDGVTDLLVGVSNDDDGGTNKGAVYILLLEETGSVKSFYKISDTQGNFKGNLDLNDRFGKDVASLGDLDGDGITDIAIGANYDGDGGYQYGAVYILFLNSNGTVKRTQKISSTYGGFTGSLGPLSSFGSSVANIGDLNKDGIVDIAVGAYRDDSKNSAKTGTLYILFLNADGTVKNHRKISAGESNFSGILEYEDYFASRIALLGDLNKDKVQDIAVSAHRDDDGGIDRGAIYILYLNNNGTVNNYQKISSLKGNFQGTLSNVDVFGSSIFALPRNSNQYINILVGAAKDDDGGIDKGAIWNLKVNNNGIVSSFKKISATEGTYSLPLKPSDNFGNSIALLDDIDGDGFKEIAASSYLDDDGGPNKGAIYILTSEHCESEQAFAGIDLNLCNSNTVTLNANTPKNGLGTWTILSGNATIKDSNNPKATAEGLGFGINTFVWTIVNDKCSSSDTVHITNFKPPSPAHTIGNIELCNTDFITLSANVPVDGTGHWTVIKGGAQILDPTKPDSKVEKLDIGKNKLVWMVSNGTCNSNTDTLTITLHEPPTTPNAGKDLIICDAYSFNLNGNKIKSGKGKWILIKGRAFIENPYDPQSKVSNISIGENIFQWSSHNKSCSDQYDTVKVLYFGKGFVKEDIPNIITPNNDKYNNSWIVKGIENFPNNEISIYNRWGRLVYSSENYDNKWSGVDLATGVYYYKLKIAPCNLTYKGYITISR